MEKYREEFPCLKQLRGGKPPIYFDNACMTLKPQPVINKIMEYYTRYPACGERSNHWFAEQVDKEVENARKKIKKFINARSEREIIFLKNTTEAINLVADSINWKKGDVVVTTDKEHNSNLLPWKKLEELNRISHYIQVDSNEDNTFSMENFKEIVDRYGKNIRVVSLYHTSNLDGTFLSDEEIKEVVKIIKSANPEAFVLIDGAQGVPHRKVDVQELGIDFLAFSVHKMVGPSGVGVLYGRLEILNKEDIFSPFIVGGGTVEDVYIHGHPKYYRSPMRFEAGLQDYAGIIGAGAAADFLMDVGMENIDRWEKELNRYATEHLENFKEIEIVGPRDPSMRSGILTFFFKKPVTVLDDEDVDLDEFLDREYNIMMRKGTFCQQVWYHKNEKKWDKFFPGFRPALYRASFYFYNTKEEIDKFIEGIERFLKKLNGVITLGV